MTKLLAALAVAAAVAAPAGAGGFPIPIPIPIPVPVPNPGPQLPPPTQPAKRFFSEDGARLVTIDPFGTAFLHDTTPFPRFGRVWLVDNARWAGFRYGWGGRVSEVVVVVEEFRGGRWVEREFSFDAFGGRLPGRWASPRFPDGLPPPRW